MPMIQVDISADGYKLVSASPNAVVFVKVLNGKVRANVDGGADEELVTGFAVPLQGGAVRLVAEGGKATVEIHSAIPK